MLSFDERQFSPSNNEGGVIHQPTEAEPIAMVDIESSELPEHPDVLVEDFGDPEVAQAWKNMIAWHGGAGRLEYFTQNCNSFIENCDSKLNDFEGGQIPEAQRERFAVARIMAQSFKETLANLSKELGDVYQGEAPADVAALIDRAAKAKHVILRPTGEKEESKFIVVSDPESGYRLIAIPRSLAAMHMGITDIVANGVWKMGKEPRVVGGGYYRVDEDNYVDLYGSSGSYRSISQDVFRQLQVDVEESSRGKVVLDSFDPNRQGM